jgi:hypothetical protein
MIGFAVNPFVFAKSVHRPGGTGRQRPSRLRTNGRPIQGPRE